MSTSPKESAEPLSKCEHCKMNIALRNPSGFCDHLYFPDNCETCKTSLSAGEGKILTPSKDGSRSPSPVVQPPQQCEECNKECPCCEELGEDKAPHKFIEHFPAGCPHNKTSPQQVMERIRKIKEIHDESIYYIEKRETASQILHIDVYGQRAENIAKLYNAFPSIASSFESVYRDACVMWKALQFYNKKDGGYNWTVAGKALASLSNSYPKEE